MSVLKVGGIGLGQHFKTLDEAVRASSVGDTIQINKSHVQINNPGIVVNHDLYLEGKGRVQIDVEDHIAGIVLVGGHLHVHNVEVHANQSNFINMGASENFSGQLSLNQVKMTHDEKLGPREYFPLINVAGPNGQLANAAITIENSVIENLNVFAQQVTLNHCKLGNTMKAQSSFAGNLAISDCMLNNVGLNNPFEQQVVVSNTKTQGRLLTQGNFVLDGLDVVKLDYDKPRQLKQLARQEAEFKLPKDAYAVTMMALPKVKLAQTQIKRVHMDTMLLKDQKEVLNLAWFNLHQCQTAFVHTNVVPTLGLVNVATGGSMTLDTAMDMSQWDVNGTQLSNRGESKAPALFDLKQTASTDALAKMDGMIGLKPVKQQVHALIDTATVDMQLKAKGKKVQAKSLHMVFAGNAGTGKTTIARIVGDALYQHGVLKTNKFVETQAKDLIGTYVGHTRKITHEKIMSALDGVLFIDEAYALSPSNGETDFASEAVDTLIADMENNRDRLIVIMAGYTDDMKHFFKVGNPGLQSRFTNWIEFPDYSATELQQIAAYDMKLEDLQFDQPSTKVLLDTGIAQLMTNQGKASGNARFVRNLLQSITEFKNSRVVKLGDTSDVALSTLTEDDVQKGLEKTEQHQAEFSGRSVKVGLQANKKPGDASVSGTQIPSQDDALVQLNALVGLDNVKHELQKIVKVSEMNQVRQSRGMKIESSSMHTVFAGNAGTGKTTVARLFGKALYQHNVLKSDKFTECTSKDLVAGFVGQTGDKTHKLVMSSLDGVLFIDEAYTLAPTGGNDFNSEAVGTLIADMEKYRDRLVVVMAGYTDEMEHFFKVGNPGLQSRFTNWIVFPDYTPSQLDQILIYQLKHNHALLDKRSTYQYLQQSILELVKIQSRNGGNGRFIRNLVQGMSENKDLRLSQQDATKLTNKQLATITLQDAQLAVNDLANRQKIFNKQSDQ